MYVAPEEVLDHVYNLMVTNKTPLGLGFVGYADEELLPEYPAVVVSAEPLARDIHATHQFLVRFNLSLWVYHAKLTDSHKVRSKSDLLLVTAIRNVVHSDFTLGGNIVFGHVDSENPGILVGPRGRRGDAVVGTRMTWTGQGRVPFN
jgi:hypothetical protein